MCARERHREGGVKGVLKVVVRAVTFVTARVSTFGAPRDRQVEVRKRLDLLRTVDVRLPYIGR